MKMGWFSKTKNVEKPPIETLQAEIDRLQSLNVEAVEQQSRLQASLEVASTERNLIRLHLEESLSRLRQEHLDATKVLSDEREQLRLSLEELQQKLHLIDEANVTMAKMLQERDAKLEEFQKLRDGDREAYQSALEQKDRKLSDLAAELAKKSSESVVRIEDLSDQLMKANETLASKIRDFEQRFSDESSKSAAAIAGLESQLQAAKVASEAVVVLEKRLATESETAANRIAQLEKQLADSETRSANRAEQRSALLRNMMEIHRLSTTSAKSEATAESLKLVTSEWSDKTVKPPENSTTEPNPFFGRASAWKENGDSESA